MRPITTTVIIAVLFASLWAIQPAMAGEYPDRPIKLMTMTKPGAQIDLLTRALADNLKDVLGQPVLVSNNPGGSHGSVMATELASAKKNGYTLGVSAVGAFTYSPHFVKTRYDFDDFTYFSLLGLNQSGIITSPDKPWKTLKEAFEWAKKEGKGLTYMFQGSDDRDVVKRIAAEEGVHISLLPSTGGPSVISAVMGGHADIGHTGAILFDYVASDKVKLLAATTPERLTGIPDVPTLKEQGWDESVEMYVVFAGPAGLPDNVVNRISEAMAVLAEDEKFRNFIKENLRMRPVEFGMEEAKAYMAKASERFAKQAAAQ
jgi:tripartite-type tricarboxylate transporter receptor subunit TctC